MGASVLELNGGALADQAGNAVLSAGLTGLNVQELSGVRVDGVTAVLATVTGTAGTYVTGSTVDLTANFSGNVTVNAHGSSGNHPRLVLDVGGSTGYATYTGAGALGLAHVFRYTVSAGESDEDGIEVKSVDLQGGTIQDSLGDDLGGLSSTVKVVGVLVDTIVPVLGGLENDPTAARSKSWAWTCTDASTPCEYRYVVNANALHTFQSTDAWGSTETTSQSTGTGTYYVHVQAKDSVGHESSVKSVSAILDNTSPLQQGSLSGPAAKTYKEGDTLSFQFSFNESMAVGTAGGTPRLVLDVGGSTKYAVYTSGSGSATLTFEWTVAEGDEDSDGVSGGTVLELNGGSLSDTPGNAVASAVLGALSVGDLSGVRIDGVRPVLTGLSDDPVEKVSKTWQWGCTDNSTPCEYRYVVNTNATLHTFQSTDAWGSTETTSQSTGTGTYYVHVQAKDSVGNESSVKSVSTLLDDDVPGIVGVTLPASKVYKEGEAMAFNVRYDDHVYVKAGASEARPVLVLSIGGVVKNAQYTGTVYAQHSDVTVANLGTELSFSYTVASGDEDADGIEISSLSQGHISDAFERLAERAVPSNGDTSGIKVDAHRPSITGLSNDLALTSSKRWTWECDDGFNCEYRFVVNTVAAHTLNSETWGSAVEATQSSGQGTYYLHVQARDENGLLSETVHVSAVLDAVAPQITGTIEVPAEGTYVSGTFLDFALNYDEDVVVTGVPSLSLSIGAQTRSASYQVSASTARRVVFRYGVQAVDSDSDGIAWDGTIQLGGAVMGDRLGNRVALLGLTVPPLTGVKVDGPLVTLTGVSIASGWKKLGDAVTLTANFSGDAKIIGSPHFILDVGGTTVNAEFSGTAESLASSHTFLYTVVDGHNDSNGIEVTGVGAETGDKLENSVGTPVVFLGPWTYSDVKVDSGVPLTPTLALETPNPSEDTTPSFSVSNVTAGERIQIYRSADCSGAVVGEKTVGFDPESLTVSAIASPGTYSFTGRVVDLAANESPCSLSVSYTLDAEAIQQVVEMGPRGDHACALSSQGEVKCWGKNSSGQLGKGHTSHLGDGAGEMGNALVPIDLGSDGGVRLKAKQIAVGRRHSCAILRDGRVKCWGAHTQGQLGIGVPTAYTGKGDEPNEMGNHLSFIHLGATAKQIAAGEEHTCAILNNDTLKCWGKNDSGQLGLISGLGAGHLSTPPSWSVNLGTDSGGASLTVKQVAAGGDHTCAILSNDRVKCWGKNTNGQLGLGDRSNRGDNANEMGNTLPTCEFGNGWQRQRSYGQAHSGGGKSHLCHPQ